MGETEAEAKRGEGEIKGGSERLTGREKRGTEKGREREAEAKRGQGEREGGRG